ncbi:hypothetical protein N9Q02_00900 [bacterium]|nr:hypothetical protein [bacterium]
MASDVMSLFGLNPNALQQQRTNDAVTQASAMNPFFAAGAAGGALMGQSVNSALGLQTPEMAQAEGVQQSLEGADLTTPEGMRDAASKLMQAGDYATAMDLYSRASSMVAAEPRPVAAKAPSYSNQGTYVLKDGSKRLGRDVDGVLMVDDMKGGMMKAPSGTLPWVAEVKPPASDSKVGSSGSVFELDGAKNYMKNVGWIRNATDSILSDSDEELAGRRIVAIARDLNTGKGQVPYDQAFKTATEMVGAGIYKEGGVNIPLIGDVMENRLYNPDNVPPSHYKLEHGFWVDPNDNAARIYKAN